MSAEEAADSQDLPLPAFDLNNWDRDDPSAPLAARTAEVARVASLPIGIQTLGTQRHVIEEHQPHTGTPIEERLMYYLEDLGDQIAQKLRVAPDHAYPNEWRLLAQLCGIDPGVSLNVLLAAHEHRVHCMNVIYKAGAHGFSIAETERRLELVRSGAITTDLFDYPFLDVLLELRQRFGGTNN